MSPTDSGVPEPRPDATPPPPPPAGLLDPSTRSTRSARSARAIRVTAVAAFVLHTLAALWIWRSWGLGFRGYWLVYMDLPISLVYLGARHYWLLVLSLVLGGLQWAVVGALLSRWIADASSRR